MNTVNRTPARQPHKALARYLSLDDFELAAKRHLPRPIFGYIAGAAERNASLDDNQRVYAEYRFITRVLRDVSKRSQSTTLFGHTWSAPFGIAPMGISALSAYRGDLVLAQAARRADIPMIMSGSSLIPLETVASAAPRTWFQAYLPGEADKIHALVERVERAGYETLVLTVDTAVLANRENNVRAGFSTPLKPSLRLAMEGITHPRWLFGTALKTLVRHGMPHFENSYATRGAPIFSRRVARDFGAKDHLNWEHVEQIRRQWKGRLIIKGLLAADDASMASDRGVDGVIVSNHGGRQLDGAVAPLRVLPEIAAAVRGRIPVMIDGGIRRGTDVLKALALGADFVFVGRPFNYAAAVAGEPGVDHAIAILRAEVQRNLGLLGLNALDELGPHMLLKEGATDHGPLA
ncbi:alpha-hydroxy-acid oxidizing protein [Burkholderia gladioli]|uniref:alpha-hydroxy acid oxidase n=1 Tax=Burkholderia gladioli TaxID=28095 RepID=UPI001364B102|nr:alpha-hydroxy acid oxidase [Burkholderia gladioli]KAF1058608.1 (S)-mandelate dehydrogenase [Burkholderia gladioli]WAG22778.1 alpha-hydroxy-acid oxidizing protein [Burkholderia gladioli]